MLTSLAFIFLVGMTLGGIFLKLRLPGLLGMMITGMILSPYALNLLDDSILQIAPDLRQLALVIILTRAGLSLNLSELKRVGRPAILLCFVPACFEMAAVILIAPPLIGITIGEAAIIGATIAAVSPAVIVPRMLRLIDEKCGTEKSIPQMLLAGASVDDVFVIILFTAFLALGQGKTINTMQLAQIPTSILFGVLFGILSGSFLVWIFHKIHIRDSGKVLIILSVSFLLLALQKALEDRIVISGLIAIMTLGVVINRTYNIVGTRLSVKYNKLWVAAEILLFVLVGATVDLQYVKNAGIKPIIVLVLAVFIRMIGVAICLIGTKLNKRERLFCMFAYTPKATVQAAIGGIPLAMGLACGNIVLTMAVLSILITAPIGAILIDKNYMKLLKF